MVHFLGFEALLGYGIEEQIKFNSTEEVPAPDPKILALHAACAGIAHMSGAAEYLDEIARDIELLRVLAEDGGSADVLVQAMISRLGVPT